LRENRLRGLTSRAVGEKSQKVTRGSHRNDVSPLTQGLRYLAASDGIAWLRNLTVIVAILHAVCEIFSRVEVENRHFVHCVLTENP